MLEARWPNGQTLVDRFEQPGDKESTMPILTPAEALRVLLDQVDYTKGACSLTEMVGAVLPQNVIQLCHAALAARMDTLDAAVATIPKGWRYDLNSNDAPDAPGDFGCDLMSPKFMEMDPSDSRFKLHWVHASGKTAAEAILNAVAKLPK